MQDQGLAVTIYGSCVSRDAMAFLEPGSTILSYIARQSIISASAPRITVPGDVDLESAFQRRMVEDDFRSTAFRTIRALAPRTDVLVLDLVDERLGVVPLPGGTYVTRSMEMVQSGLLGDLTDQAVVEFGTDEHFALWQRAAGRFIRELDELDLIERTLLVEGTFAYRDETGQPAPMSNGRPAEVWNSEYVRYHDVLKRAGIETHTAGERAVTDTRHKWGPAAFHYTADAYRAVVEAVREVAVARR